MRDQLGAAIEPNANRECPERARSDAARATAAIRSASARDGANAKPVGPHELCPIPVAPARASASSTAATSGLMKRDPPCAGAK